MGEKGTSIYLTSDTRDRLQAIAKQEFRSAIDTIRYLIALYTKTTPTERAEILARSQK